ncbi:MAG: DUF1700 domain-containing protein [Acholeplasmataceae bacterium]|nr:DUF1700 domain-containing protein [Acholeplasmataceae bacterium]
MNKNNYLIALEYILKLNRVSKNDVVEVLQDYDQLYEDALNQGKSDEEVYLLLGEPEDVYSELKDTLSVTKKRKNEQLLVSLSPFIATITFLFIGLTLDIWHPTWLIFLIIPMSGIIFNTGRKERIVALSPFVAVIVFLSIGFFAGIWHPTWLIFLIIPTFGILLYTEKNERLTALTPFISGIIFVILGHYFNLWNPGWLVFLIIPISGLLFEKQLLKRYLYLGSLIFAIAFYLYFGYVLNEWGYGLLGFLLPLLIAIFYRDIQVFINSDGQARINKIFYFITVITAIIGFLLLGILLNGWAYGWMIFLLIPIVSILLSNTKSKMSAITPFLAVIIFFTLGYFFNLFHLSWLVFLFIPVVSIIENK